MGHIIIHAAWPLLLYNGMLAGVSLFFRISRLYLLLEENTAAAISLLGAVLCLPFLVRARRSDGLLPGDTSLSYGNDGKRSRQFPGSRPAHSAVVQNRNLQAGARKRNAALRIAGLLALGAVCSILSAGITYLAGLQRLFPDNAQEQLRSAALWLQLAGPCLLVPAAEELAYHGLLYERLQGGMPASWAAAVTALCFAAGHGNMIQFLYALPMSFILTWAYRRYGGLSAPFLVHAGANLASVVIQAAMR